MDVLLTHGYFLALRCRPSSASCARIRRSALLYLSSHLKSRGMHVGVFDSTFRTMADFKARRSSASGRRSSASPST